MAIRRCPYCKAIIDGVASYCSNCGTQLLFPEDESEEEEIPGDKILEEDETLRAEEDSEKKEPSPEREEEEKEEAPQIKEEDVRAAEAERLKETADWVKKETQRIWDSAVMEEGETPPTPEEEKKEVPESAEIEFPESEAAEREEKEITPQKEETDFRTFGLKRTPDTEKREKEDIDKFVESIKKERGKEALASEEPIPPSAETEKVEKEEIDLRRIRLKRTPDTEEREKEDIDKLMKSIKEKKEDEVKETLVAEEKPAPAPEGVKERTPEVEEGVPPWAEKIKEVPPPELEEIEEVTEEERPIELGEDLQEKEKKPPEDEYLPSEKEIGLPEEVEQKGLPLDRETEIAKKRARMRRRLRFYARLKSRAFDFVFMTAFCLVSLGIASRLMNISIFKLIYVSALPALIFYLVLLMFYFVFFIFFLGETPGDRLFPRD